MCWNSKPASLEWIASWSSPYESWRLSFFRELGVGVGRGHLGWSAGMGAGAHVGLLWELKGRPCIFLHRRLPFLRVFVIIVSTTSHITLSHPCQWWQWGLRPSAVLFPVPCFLLFSHPHILVLKSLVPDAAALPFTFIRWRHSKRAAMASLVSQGRGLDPIWCQWFWAKMGATHPAVSG